MCEFSKKLIAWLDRELAPGESQAVASHLVLCAECRAQLAAYEQVSASFDAYCNAIAAHEVRRSAARWALPASATVAVTAIVVLLLVLPRTHPQPRPATLSSATAIARVPPGVESMEFACASMGKGS